MSQNEINPLTRRTENSMKIRKYQSVKAWRVYSLAMNWESWFPVSAFVGFVLIVASHSFGQTNDSGFDPRVLRVMSLEELAVLDVTSVSREPEAYGQAPAAIQVITREDIRRSGVSSIPEALRLASNLVVAQKGSHSWAISARGFNTDLANKLLVLIDGRTVYTPLFSGVFWDRQDYLLEDIERIEVVSGPGGTLWGANAVNGVISIITRTARDSLGLFLEVGGGTQLRDFMGVRYGGALASNVFFRVYGKYFDRGNEPFPDGSDASDAWRKGQGGFRIDADVSAGDTFTLQGDFYAGGADLSTGGRSKLSGGNLIGRWSHVFSGDSDMKLQFYYDRTHLANPTPPLVLNSLLLAPAGILKDDLATWDLDLQHRFPLGDRNRVVWGMGYRFTHNVVGNAPGLAFIPPVLDRHLFSGFVQDELRLARNLAFTAGTKLEHNDYTGFELEPNARLQWDMTDRQMVWASVSRAVRMPSRVDRHERLPTPALSPLLQNILIGGANFASETVIAYELGYRSQFSSRVFASVAAFYNQYDHLRSTSLSPPDPILRLPFPLFFENNLEGETYGTELSVTGQVRDWWRLRAGYNFLHEDIRVKPGKVDLNNAFNETADPPHQFSLRSSMNFRHNLELDAGMRWVDAFRFNNSGVAAIVPAYAELNAHLSWRPAENLQLSAVGENLFHGHHLEYVISSPNPREEIGRSVYGKLAIRW